MGQVVDIKTARCHVGSHEQLNSMLTEFLHRQVALLLTKVAMQGFCVVAVFDKLVGNLLSLYLCATEDDSENLRIEVYDALQSQVLVACMYHIIYVVHMLRTLVARTNHNLLIVGKIALGHTLHLAAHSGREQESVAILRHILEYLVYRVCKTHVEHLVSLVEHHILYIVAFHNSAMHKVDQTTRSSNNNLHAMAQSANLCFDRCTAIYGSYVQTIYIFGKFVQVVGYLQAQLASRAKHQGLRSL